MPHRRQSGLPVKWPLVQRRPTVLPAKSPPRRNFKKRYEEVEAKRAELVARLHSLSEPGRRHPSYKHALRLLNDIFRKEKLAQRAAVLEAATWVIDILENMAIVL